MDTGDLIEKVQIGIDDPTVLEDTILAALNTRLKQVASGNFLPDLIEEDTVTFSAGAADVAMPDNYDHSLLYAYSNTNSKDLIIRSNSKALYKNRDRTQTGSISEVAADGTTLNAYQGTTDEDEVNLQFYGKPDALVNDSDEPTCIPDDLREIVLADSVIYDFLCKKKPTTDLEYKIISDGKQTAVSNVKIGLQLMGERFKDSPRPKPILRRQVRTF